MQPGDMARRIVASYNRKAELISRDAEGCCDSTPSVYYIPFQTYRSRPETLWPCVNRNPRIEYHVFNPALITTASVVIKNMQRQDEGPRRLGI
jgi:hypothetical protein